MTSRKLALSGSLALSLAGAAAIAGCAAFGTPTPTPAPAPAPLTQLQTYAGLMQPVLDIVVPALLAKPGISAADMATITQAQKDIEAATQAIAASASAGPVNAQTLVTALRTLGPVAIKYLTTDAYTAGLMQAGIDITPLILQAAGVVVPVMAAQTEAAREARAVAVLQGARR